MGYEVHVYCDNCGIGLSWTPNHTVAKGTAEWICRNRGWTVGKKWLCPNCCKKKGAKKDGI